MRLNVVGRLSERRQEFHYQLDPADKESASVHDTGTHQTLPGAATQHASPHSANIHHLHVAGLLLSIVLQLFLPFVACCIHVQLSIIVYDVDSR